MNIEKKVIFTRMACVCECVSVCTSGRERPNSNKKTFERIQNLLFDLEVVLNRGAVAFAACSLDSCLCRSSAYCATLMTFGYQPLLVLYNI